jgi:hypothetical protein
MIRHWSLVLVAAVAALLSIGIAPARAQPATTDSTSYVDPVTGTVVRITKDELRDRIELVRNALAGIDGGQSVLLTGSERPTLISFDQLKRLARKLVTDGAIEPGEEQAWIIDKMRTSREAVQPVRDLLTALEEGRWRGGVGVAPPTTPSTNPSSLAAFRGGLRGSWEITCLRGERKLEFRNWGTWFLDFAGDGTVSGWLEDFQGTRRPSTGTIDDSGLASGESVNLRWSATFVRDGNSLAMTGGEGSLSYTRAVLDAEPGLDCSPGRWRKT